METLPSLIGLPQFVIVRGVTLGNLFLSELAAQFAVHLHTGTSGEFFAVLHEKSGLSGMQKSCRRKKKRRITKGVQMVEKTVHRYFPVLLTG